MRYLRLLLIPLIEVACTEPLSSPNVPLEDRPETVVHPSTVTGCPTGPNMPMCPGSGDPIPPAVTIYDINMVEIESLTVDAGESFTLIGVAVGNIPFTYVWLQTADGNTVQIGGTSYLINYVINEPGDYVIIFEVTDANGLVGSDQVAVTVLPSYEPTVDGLIMDMIARAEEADPSAWRSIEHQLAGILRLDALLASFRTGDYDAAYSDLLYDIKPRLTGLMTDAHEVPILAGVFALPWVVSPYYQELFRNASNSVMYGLLELGAQDVVGPEGALLTVDFWGLAEVDVVVRESDGTKGSSSGPDVAAASDQSDEAVLMVPRGNLYDVLLTRGAVTLIVDDVDCTESRSGFCFVGDLADALTVLPVSIDIKPGSSLNTINLGSNGNVPVAIFSTPHFDATSVDPATVKLADAGVRVAGKKGRLQAAMEDVNSDGLPDLIVHIDTEGLSLGPGDVVAVLTGATYDGQAIRGEDTVRIIPEIY